MTAQTMTQAGRADLLRRALQGDAIFCGITGVFFLLDSGPIAAATGIPSVALLILGGVLIPYAALLWYAATRPTISRAMAWTAVVLNALWVLDSIVLLALGLLPLTPLGWWAILGIAFVVAAFAEAQYLGIRRA